MAAVPPGGGAGLFLTNQGLLGCIEWLYVSWRSPPMYRHSAKGTTAFDFLKAAAP